MCTRMGWLWGRSFLFFAMSFFATSILHGAERSESATKAALRLADEQATETIREALQREAYGLIEDREQLLSAASLAAPNNPAVRWQLGFVRSSSGEWIKAEERGNKKRVALLKAYEARRAKAGEHAEGQLELADWCNQHGLRERERVHLLRVCELVPNHDAARQRLGFIRAGNNWISRQEFAEQQQRSAQAQAELAHWSPRLERLAAAWASSEDERRTAAIAELRAIKDPAAVPALRMLLGTRSEEAELLVVEIISAIHDPAAVEALARHAAFSPSLRIRKIAVEKLKSCPTEQFVPQIISSMFTPVVSRISQLALPNGRIGYRQEFLREGAESHQMLVLDTQYRRIAAPNANVADSLQRAAREGQRTAAGLAQAAAAQNEYTAALNDRLAWVLNQATGANLPAVPDEWWSWWLDENEIYVAGTKGVATIRHSRTVLIVERDPTGGSGSGGSGPSEDPRITRLRNSSRPPVNDGRSNGWVNEFYDCLVAGTPVWTERGEVAIERIRPGDLVLSRDVDSGELAYKPVLRTTLRPEGPLVRVRAGKEVFESSGGHPFWVSGQGWIKARNLQIGMVLHTTAGPVNVLEVGEAPAAPTHNLIVADFSTYFVGKQKILSHDNTIRQPTNAIVPGLVIK